MTSECGKRIWAGFLLSGISLLTLSNAAFAQASTVEGEINGQTEWVADAIEMVEFIEENELVLKPNSHTDYEKLVFDAPSAEKLDRLYAMLIDALFVGSKDVSEAYLPIYVQEIEDSGSIAHQHALKVFKATLKGFSSWSYDVAITELEEIASSAEMHPYAQIRALAISGYLHGYSGNPDIIVTNIRKMESIAENAPYNLFIDKEIIGLKAVAAAHTNDHEEMVKYSIEDIKLGYKTNSLINGDVTSGNFTYLIMEHADIESIDRVDALNQRIAHMTGDDSVIFRAYVSCLESAVRKARTDRALECQSEAEKFITDNSQVYVRYHLYSAIAFARAGNTKKARDILNAMQAIPDIQSSVYFKKDGDWATSEVLQSEGQYAEAYRGLRDYFDHKFSTQKIELGEVSKSLRLYSEEKSALQDEKNKVLASKDVLQNRVISRQRILILLIGLMGLGMCWFGYIQKINTKRLGRAREKTIKANETIRRESRTDQLTRIGNRRAFYEYCRSITENSEYSSLTLGILDLDGFKQVNDTFGHEAGDTLIVETSQRLARALEGKGQVFRLGGDEFAIIFLPQDNANLSAFRSCISGALDGKVKLDNHSIDLVGSIGAVKLEGENLAPSDFLNQADYALYQAKLKRGTSFHVFSDADLISITQEKLMAEEVLWNLNSANFVMFGQVVVTSENGNYRPYGVEALLRAQTRSGDVISPEVFVQHAVLAGKANLLTKLSLRKSIEMLQSSSLDCLLLFNLSREQFRDPRLLDVIVETLEETNFSGHQLIIELSECTLDHDLVFAAETLTALKYLGVRIGLDDFGSANTGFSSLFEFDFDVIKTDRNLLCSSMESERTKHLMFNLIELSKKLKVPCIIEGLETPAEVSFVSGLGGEILQGYIFSHPAETPKFRANSDRFVPSLVEFEKPQKGPRKIA